MLSKHALMAAVLFAVMTGAVQAQDWEEQSQMEEDYSNAGQETQYGADVPQDYVQEEPVQEEYVQEEPQYDSGEDYQQQEYVQDEYVQEEQVQEEYVQEEYVQEEPQYEPPQDYQADIAPEMEWAQQMGTQCNESADADGLEGAERDDFIRSCMQP